MRPIGSLTQQDFCRFPISTPRIEGLIAAYKKKENYTLSILISTSEDGVAVVVSIELSSRVVKFVSVKDVVSVKNSVDVLLWSEKGEESSEDSDENNDTRG